MRTYLPDHHVLAAHHCLEGSNLQYFPILKNTLALLQIEIDPPSFFRVLPDRRCCAERPDRRADGLVVVAHGVVVVAAVLDAAAGLVGAAGRAAAGLHEDYVDERLVAGPAGRAAAAAAAAAHEVDQQNVGLGDSGEEVEDVESVEAHRH